jgi:hypothetical protein
MSYPQRSIAAALTLFFLAPLVAEYLLGDLPITLFSALIILAPMYGGGALLIRELTRRTGRGWATMLLLGCAYTLIEEGFSTQTLFNPNTYGMHLLRFAWIPSLGIGAWWTLFMLNLHPFWSIGVSIALAEGLFPARARTPWLGKIGTSVVALLYAAGIIANAAYAYHQSHFRASNAQFLVTALLTILIVIAAFLLPSRAASATAGQVPSPWLTGAGAFLLGLVVFLAFPIWGWGAVAMMLAADLVFLISLGMLARRSGWTPLHTLSLAAGGAIFYGLHAFTGNSLVHAPHWIVRTGNAIFLVLAILAIVLAVRRVTANAALDPVNPQG